MITEVSFSQVKAIFETLSTKQIIILAEITLNFLKGNLYVNSGILKILKRRKDFLRNLASKNISLTQKKKLIVSQYKFMVYFLKSVKPLLETLVQK